jgi:hypothetical protein
MAHHIGNLVELPVVHLKEGMENPPLYRLKPVLQVGDGPIFDNIGRVFQKIFIKYVFYVCHYTSNIYKKGKEQKAPHRGLQAPKGGAEA